MAQSNQRGWSLTRKMDSNQIDAQSPSWRAVAAALQHTRWWYHSEKGGFECFNWLLFLCNHKFFFIGFLFDRAAAKVQLRRFTFGSLSAESPKQNVLTKHWMDRQIIAAADQSVWTPGWHTESNCPDKSWRITCMLPAKSHSLLAAQQLTDWWIDNLFKEPFIQRADHAALMDG